MNFDVSRCMPYVYLCFWNSWFLLCFVQVVVAPILLGSYILSSFPLVVKIVTPFAPLFAVLVSSLLACRLSLLKFICWIFHFSLFCFTFIYSSNFWFLGFHSVFSQKMLSVLSPQWLMLHWLLMPL